MNNGRFINVGFEDNRALLYAVNELGMTFEGTTDNDLQARIDACCGELCETMGVDGFIIRRMSARIKAYSRGRISECLHYVVISVLVDLWEDTWMRTTIPVELSESEIEHMIDLAAKSYREELEETWQS